MDAYKQLLDGGGLLASRTVFTPKSTTVDDQRRLFRSSDALRPLTSVPVSNNSPLSAVTQLNDASLPGSWQCIFEIETSALGLGILAFFDGFYFCFSICESQVDLSGA